MIVNFVGNFGAGYVGEVGDATHLAREMKDLGHTVRRVPQDVWKANCDGEFDPKWTLPLEKADINIICKWHHFNSGKYISLLKSFTKAPVFYWVWDYMWDMGIPEWHREMVEEADLYLGNDVRSLAYSMNKKNAYYFPFDVADVDLIDKDYPILPTAQKKYDVTFFGSWIGQGNRQQWLTEINTTNPITVFSWNPKDWPKEFETHEAVYGKDFVQKVRQSKIVLGFSVEPNSWGYWSNRVGKVLTAGGFLLYQYAPGMELFLKDGVEYFSSIEEAREKIDHFLIAETERDKIASKGYNLGKRYFTSEQRVKELMILIERYLKKGDVLWQL